MKGRVALVDDSPDMRVLFGTHLTDDRWSLTLAATIDEVLDDLLHGKVDVLLLDRNLAGVDAVDRLPELLSAVVSELPPAVIVLTAHARPEDRLSGLEAGAVDYVGKDIPMAELRARVAAQLTRVRHLRDHLRRRTQDAQSLVDATIEIARQPTTVDVARVLVSRLVTTPDVDAAAVVVLEGHARGEMVTAVNGGSVVANPGPLGEDVLDLLGAQLHQGPWSASRLPAALHAVFQGDVARVAGVPLHDDEQVLAVLLAGAAPGSGSGLRMLASATTLARVATEPYRRLSILEQAQGQLDGGLDAALSGEGILPVFHEVRDIGSGRVEGYEALTRFTDGALPEPRFRAAQLRGLGVHLELQTLALQLEAAQALPPDRWVAVNLSPSTLVAEELGKVLRASEREVVIELTEHEPVTDYEAMRQALAGLPGTPRLAVDDAGSGYACLAHVFSLRPDFVKLDRVWVSGLEHDPARRALIAGITGFADEIGSRVIAEGVEGEIQVDHLRTLGVDLVQGHLFGQPFTILP